MTASVAELATILRKAGLMVNTDYASAATPGTFNPIGLILHHDAAGLSYVDGSTGDDTAVARNMASPGGLGAQFWVGRSGTWYILSAGRKSHAGLGRGWGGISANGGNSSAYGIETDYGPVRPGWSGPTCTESGYTWPVWDQQQLDSINVGSRALARALNLSTFCGHREYASDRKIDPANFDLDAWRAYIAAPTPNIPDVDVDPIDLAHYLEAIMALPGAPSTYQQAVADIVNGVVVALTDYDLPADPEKAKAIPRTVERATQVAINRINHAQNFDGSKPQK